MSSSRPDGLPKQFKILVSPVAYFPRVSHLLGGRTPFELRPKTVEWLRKVAHHLAMNRVRKSHLALREMPKMPTSRRCEIAEREFSERVRETMEDRWWSMKVTGIFFRAENFSQSRACFCSSAQSGWKTPLLYDFRGFRIQRVSNKDLRLCYR